MQNLDLNLKKVKGGLLEKRKGNSGKGEGEKRE
jgi:hypothetical protein